MPQCAGLKFDLFEAFSISLLLLLLLPSQVLYNMQVLYISTPRGWEEAALLSAPLCCTAHCLCLCVCCCLFAPILSSVCVSAFAAIPPSPPLSSPFCLHALAFMSCVALRCAVAASNVLLVSSMSRECLMSRKQGCRMPGLPGGGGGGKEGLLAACAMMKMVFNTCAQCLKIKSNFVLYKLRIIWMRNIILDILSYLKIFILYELGRLYKVLNRI